MYKGLCSHIQKSRCMYVNFTSIINKVFKESPDIDSRGLVGSSHEVLRDPGSFCFFKVTS